GLSTKLVPEVICSVNHCPKLQDLDLMPILAATRLAEEDRSSGVEFDPNRGPEQNRRSQHQTDRGREHIEGTLRSQVDLTQPGRPDAQHRQALEFVKQ